MSARVNRVPSPTSVKGTYLKERNDQTDHTIAPKASRIYLVHASLVEEGLDDEHKRLEGREGRDVGVDDLSCRDSVRLVDGDVDG